MILRMALMLMVGTSLLVCTACMNLGLSTSPEPHYYLLEAKAETRISTQSQNRLAGITLGVGPVTIASYLDRPQLVSRVSGNKLRVDEFHLWAEPLKANITRVIKENLSVLTDAGRVQSYPKRRSVIIDYQIILDVLRFDAGADGSVTLKSAWRIVKPDTDQRAVERRMVIVQQSSSKDSGDVIDAMSMALATLSNEMAQVLVDVVNG